MEKRPCLFTECHVFSTEPRLVKWLSSSLLLLSLCFPAFVPFSYVHIIHFRQSWFWSPMPCLLPTFPFERSLPPLPLTNLPSVVHFLVLSSLLLCNHKLHWDMFECLGDKNPRGQLRAGQGQGPSEVEQSSFLPSLHLSELPSFLCLRCILKTKMKF